MTGPLAARSFARVPDPGRSDRLDGEHLVRLVSRNWRLILAVVVAVVGAVAVFLTQQVPVYRAVAAMALMNSEVRVSQVDTQLESYELTRARVETELDRLRSRTFASRVADKLDLFKDTTYLPVGEKGPAVGTPERRRAVVDKLLASYMPRRTGESLVIYIEAEASAPEMAARIANGVVEAFIRQSVDDQRETIEQSSKYLRGQIDLLGDQLTASQAEMATLIRENVLDDEDLDERLRRQRSHLVAVLEVSGQRGGSGGSGNLRAELDQIEAQLADRTRSKMHLSRLERSVDLLGQRLQTMVERLGQIEPQLDQVQPDARQVTIAETPFEPSWPNIPTTLALAVPGGLMLGFLIALIKSGMDRQVWTGAQAGLAGRVPNLGQLPRIRPRGILRRRHQPGWFLRRFPRAVFSEELRALLTICGALQAGGSPPQVIMITSARDGEGKSTLAAAMATTAAQEGMRVLLLDFDGTAAGAGHLLGAREAPLLRIDDVLADPALAASPVPVPDQPGLALLRFDPRARLASARVAAFGSDVLPGLRAQHDLIILDTPAALGASDAARLGALADATLVVARAGRTPEHELRQCVARLQDSGVQVAGTIVNDMDLRLLQGGGRGRRHAAR